MEVLRLVLHHGQRGLGIPLAAIHLHTSRRAREGGLCPHTLCRGRGGRRHAVGASHTGRCLSKLVGHRMVDTRGVPLHVHGLHRAALVPVVVRDVQAVRIVVGRIHLQVRVHHRAGALTGGAGLESVRLLRHQVDAQPRGVDVEGSEVRCARQVVGRREHRAARSVQVRIAAAGRVAAKDGGPAAAVRRRRGRVDVSERTSRQLRVGVPTGRRPLGHDIHGGAETALILDIERALADFNPVDLGKVHVERRRIHVVRAGAVDAGAIDQHGEVLTLIPANHNVVGHPAAAHLPDAGKPGERLADVARPALADPGHLQRVAIGAADDVHRFDERFNLEDDVEHGGVAGLGIQFYHRRAKPVERGGDLVVLCAQARDAVDALVARSDLGHLAALGGDGDHDAGQARAVRRLDGSGDRRGGDRRGGGGTRGR